MKFLNVIDGADKLITDVNNRLVTDEQINEWDNKASNLTLNELVLGGRFKLVYNDIEDSLDFEVI